MKKYNIKLTGIMLATVLLLSTSDSMAFGGDTLFQDNTEFKVKENKAEVTTMNIEPAISMPNKLGERTGSTEPNRLGDRGNTEPTKLGERGNTNPNKLGDRTTLDERPKDNDNKPSAVKPNPPKKIKKSNPTKKVVQTKPKKVEKPIAKESIVEETEEKEELTIEETVQVVKKLTTSRLDIGTVDNTPYNLLSPIIQEDSGARKQYITRAEVADILQTALKLDVESFISPYKDIDSTIYMLPVIAVVQNKYMTPVDKTEFGAWDRITWDELSHIVRIINTEGRNSFGRNIMNKNMNMNGLLYNNLNKTNPFPTKSIAVRVLESELIRIIR